MKPNIRISFGLLIAHFLPGSFVVLSIFWGRILKPDVLDWMDNNQTTAIIISILLSLIIGLIIDSIRYSFTCLLSSGKKYDITFKGISSDDIVVYESFLEHYFRYHQFYGNMSIATLVSLFILCEILPCYLILLSILIIVVLFYASYRTFNKFMERLCQKFSK